MENWNRKPVELSESPRHCPFSTFIVHCVSGAFGFYLLDRMFAGQQTSEPLNTYIAMYEIIQAEDDRRGKVDKVHRDGNRRRILAAYVAL